MPVCGARGLDSNLCMCACVCVRAEKGKSMSDSARSTHPSSRSSNNNKWQAGSLPLSLSLVSYDDAESLEESKSAGGRRD